MSKWTPERLKKDRESWEAKNNSRATNLTASTGTAAGKANTTDKWTPERIAKARESWEAKSSGQNAASPAAAARQNTGTGLGARVLAQMTGADSSHKLQLAVPQETGKTQAYPGKSGIVTDSGTGTRSSTAQPEWLNAKSAAAPAAKVTGTVQPTERQRIAGIASGDEGWYAQTAQKVRQYTEDLKATDDLRDFDRLNQWMDADPKHRELVTLMRIGTGGQSYAEKNNAMQPQSVSGAAARAAVPEKSAGRRDYTDAELLAKGYSRKEISEARQYIADFDALPAGKRAARRAANTIGGIGDTVASSVFLAGETGVQSAKNAAATSGNWKQLQQDVQSDDRQQELLRLMTGGKTRYAARDNTLQLAQSSGAMASAPAAQTTQSDAYTDAELIEKGYTQQEIDNMRARIAGTEVHDSVDPEKSFGYQLYKRGQDLTAAAQSGLSPIAKQALGIVSSAGENLAVAAIDPAWVLPVLSAQGGAEAMGQSIEKGESAGKTLAGGLAKFGAGWAINSVGAADLAKTMGADYAKDTLAGKLADMVRSVAADGTLAQRYPAVANAISGGVDNAMQAFVETYADKAIDATLGDSEAAADLFKSDTFLTALESGLTGGASGALGGAVGTGLAKANGGDASIVGNVKRAYYEGQVERARQALQDEVRAQEPGTAMQQTPEEAAAGTRQPAAATQETVQPEVTGTTSGFATMQDTAPMVQSENPAVQQLAAAVQDGQLTSKTINLFTPNAANEANRAAFAEEYGIELPETAAKTRQVLREMTTQQRAAQAPATATENATVEAQKTAAIVERMEADRSAQQAQTESELGRSGAAVENTGERVESGPAEQSGRMRETYGLEQQSLTTKQREVQQELTRWQVSDGASATISRNMPTEIGDAGRYAAAASSLYRLGQMEDVHTFDKAMELAQGMSGLAVNTDYVLAQDGGREALQLAWLQGHGELEAGKMQRASLGGRLTAESTSGSGRVLYKGTMRTANEVGTQLIELNAKATNTDAVLKTVLQGNDRVRAYVDTETARIFFSDRAEDVFGTILHEDYHWYNSLDAEGAQALQQHALEFLAKSEGFEGIDEMIRGKLSDYARQGLSYEEAAEELVADAWRGIFSDEASFKRWVEFQRGQAEKNAGKAGGIHKVMTKVKELLSDIVSRAKEVLARDPENKAALKAQRLAAAEKRVLQDEYFAHAERAMDSLRAAKENAAALENKGAAEGTRFEIKKDAEGETYIQIDEDILKGIPQENWKSVVKQAIRERFPDGFVRNGWTILNSKDGRNEFVWSKYSKALQWENATAYADKMRMAANLDEIIETADEVYREPANHKNAEAFNRGRIKIRVGENVYEADVLTAIKPDTREIFYDIVNIKETKIKPSGGTHVESEDSRSRLPESFTETFGKAHMESEDSGSSGSKISNQSIAQEAAENKGNDGTLKKNVRYQLSEADELTKLRDEQQQLDEQRRELKEERSAWLGSDAVKEIEAKKKALGIFSAEAKAYRDSEEYQNYLAKRKDYNARMAQLEDQSAVLNGRIKGASARMQQQNAEKGKVEQAVYDAKAEAHGGKAEYRRVLAKERFGTTEDFRRAGYILPDGQMLDFAQNDRTRDTDHREIMSVFGSAEVKNGTEALNEFLLDGNVRVMAEAPGVDLSADTAPTTQQLEQIWRMVQELGGEKRQFTLDISTADGRVAAGKEYSGRVDADRVVREIREYYQTGELAQESDLAKFRYQLAEQADRDAKRNDQQMASRTIADKAAALDTLSQFFGLTRGVKVSRTAIEGLASRWAKANGSKADRAKLARETEVLVDYLKADGADMEKANALAETLAGEILDGAVYRNSELWDEYPELHKLEYTVNRSGQAKAELVKAYGSWSEAVAEARRHGVTLRQAESVRDGNPAQQYESVINDNRAVDGTSDGAKALWKAAAQQAGVDGAMSMESTEWLNVLMKLHDAIKPATMSRFADDAEYEDAKIELAGRIIGDIMATPEMTDAQAIFEGIQRHNMDVARAAAGSKERAAEVAKELRGVQKAQQREFGRRMQENRRTANQNAEVQQMTELQRQNARAEKLLNQNLETFGVDVSNVGNLNEKLTVLRESYEREMKQEVKRLKAERQEMLDEAKLWYRERMGELREENADLSMRLREEQRRADKAEYSLIVQENEIMEWEADNERKRAAWEQKQAQRNALAIETARQQRDEDIAVAKAVAEKRVQRARDARKMDELKRSIRQNAAQLNQMLLRPSKDKYVQPGLIDAAAQVAKLADMTILNERAVNQLTRLQDRIRQSAGSENSPNAMTEEWKQTGVDTLIQTLRDDLQTTKDAKLTKLHEQLAEAEVLPDSEKAWALQERLRKRIKETENRTYLPMTVDQMRVLKAITSSTLHVIRNANKTVSLAKAEEVSTIAEGAASEVNASKGNHPGGKLDGVHNLLTKYQLDMLGAERVFRMLGGYAKNGQMEKMAQMLNDGQYRQTKITVEGEKLFANVTGKENVKEMQNFAGPGADLVDVGLTDVKGKKAELTHAQLCSLYMHLHNTDSLNHLMNGGLVIPDAKLYNKGDIEQAYQKGQTVHLGMLTDADGTPTADSILQTVEAAMTDYDRAWCADMKEFFDNYTAKLINETSLQLVGYQRATVKNYYPIAVDKSVLATQIDGLNLDATIEGRGFLKNRVKSGQPILLEECANVVQRSLRDTADYAGLAAPIRDVQKILNSGVETREGLKNLKNGIIKEQWGGDAVNYIDNLLKDLQKKSRQRKSTLQWLGNLSSKYAGAVLTLNPGVALAQAASLPTAAAVLGGDTMAAVVPFVKNLSPKARTALETEIKEHGDVLLDWRKRGSQNGELASIGKQETLAEKGMDKLPNWLTGWINGMDEVTVAALWEGSKRYVQHHTAEFEGAEVTGSPAYWEAVNRTYQKVIEQTQPNYTVMQRAGIQRNPDGMAKALTMFTTQRFQNYGILADAVGDYKAQVERYRAESSAENKAEVQRAGQQLRRAVASQTVQTVTFALMKMGVGFVLHRWKDLQDENGDMTLKSLLKRLGELCMESFAGTGLYGSEIYGFASNAVTGNDYDVVSAANLGLVNEFAAAAGKFAYELRKDIGGMDEDEAEKHDRKLWTLAGNVVEAGLQALGVPYANGKKFVEAAAGWYGTLQDWKKSGKYGNFDSLPQSATGQYDRLYNAYLNGDRIEAKAAVEKLNGMAEAGIITENKMYQQLTSRLRDNDRIKEAAKQTNAGNWEARKDILDDMAGELNELLGTSGSDARDAIVKAIDAVSVAQYAAERGHNKKNVYYTDLKAAAAAGDVKEMQAEVNSLLKAGKTPDNIKDAISEAVRDEYKAGSDSDREEIEETLLQLAGEDGETPLYTEKTFSAWAKSAEKEAEEKEFDRHDLLK